MRDMTAEHLRSAFGGESMAAMRYKVWSSKALEEGFPNVSRLFVAIAAAEQAHATGHFKAMRELAGPALVASGGGFGLGNTSANLQAAIDGELFEVNEMYPVYLEGAKYQKEKEAVLSFHYALTAEKIHAAMYEKAKQSTDAGQDAPIGALHVCTVCGYTHEGGMPEKCPVCSKGPESFLTFAQ